MGFLAGLRSLILMLIINFWFLTPSYSKVDYVCYFTLRLIHNLSFCQVISLEVGNVLEQHKHPQKYVYKTTHQINSHY